MSHLPVSETPAGVMLRVRVIPRSRTTELAGLHGETLKVRLVAPPVEGAANRALLAFLADQLGLRPRQLQIVSGATSRDKVVAIEGLTAAEVEQRLADSLQDKT